MINKIQINKIIISKLEPVKNSFKNKNDKFSAKGFWGEKKVKIFEVFDKNQGPLIEFISNTRELSQYFPKLITYNEKFIVEEWINGKTLRELGSGLKKTIPQTEEVKHIISLMWSLKYEKQVFNYLEYIHKRINKKFSLDLKNVPIRVNHNDLSLDNIILSSEGLKIIDNEFLGCNTGWVLNIKNSFLQDDDEYQNYISTETLNALWIIRKEWSKINSNKLKNKSWTLKNLIKKLL
jgi:serine/threonine protein kinase